MNNAAQIRLRTGLIPLLVAIALFAAGCATTPKIDWNARVANYTYEQAVIEMGPPDRREELKDGTMVAEWLTSRGTTETYIVPGYNYGYHRRYYAGVLPTVVNSTTSDYFIRLIFGPDGKLTAWKKFVR